MLHLGRGRPTNGLGRVRTFEPDFVPAMAVIAIATLLKLAAFAALDRPWGCNCGRIWAMPGNSALNSQVMLDPYTAMHLVFGAGLVLMIAWLRPDWSRWTLIAAVVASSTVWEVIENLPMTIRMFGYEAGDPLMYRGDSSLNALTDTATATAGAVVAQRVPAWSVVALAAATEIGLSLVIRDGFVIAAWRAMLQVV